MSASIVSRAADPRRRGGRRAAASRSGTSRAMISTRPASFASVSVYETLFSTAASAFSTLRPRCFGERPDEGARVLLGLLVHRLRQVLALAADRMRRARVRAGRHRGDVAGQQQEESRPRRPGRRTARRTWRPEPSRAGSRSSSRASSASRPPGVESVRTTSAAPSFSASARTLCEIVRPRPGGSACRSAPSTTSGAAVPRREPPRREASAAASSARVGHDGPSLSHPIRRDRAAPGYKGACASGPPRRFTSRRSPF